MDSIPSAEQPVRSRAILRRFAAVSFDATLIVFLLWFFFSPPWHLFAAGARISGLAEIVELRRGAAVALQLAHPFALIADPVHRSIQWRLLFPVIGYALHLPTTIVLAMPFLGAWLAIAAILFYARREGVSRPRAVAAAIVLSCAGWFFASTGWLGYFDSWIVLALLVVSYTRGKLLVWCTCALAPWIDERFLIGLPIALGLRLSRTPKNSHAAIKDYYRLVTVGAALSFAFVLLRVLGRSGSIGLGEYIGEQQTFHTPVSRHLQGLWQSLRIAWLPAGIGLTLAVRRLAGAPGVAFAAGVTLTMVASEFIANDLSRAMTILLPLGLEGAIIIANAPPRIASALFMGALLTLGLPAQHVVTDFTMPIPRLPTVIRLWRERAGSLDPITWVDAAVRLIAEGRRADAARYITVALNLDEHCGAAYNARGFLATESQQWRLAFENFVLACRYSPSEPSYWLHQAFAASKLSDIDSYRRAISEAKRLANPNSDVAARIASLEKQVQP
jgi:hypothetical protein